MRNLASLAIPLVILTGCQARYLVMPAVPHYVLRSPNGEKSAFPDTTSRFGNSFDGWVDLGPGMSIKLDKAYFLPSESRQLRDYRGLESAQYRYQPTGVLDLTDYLSLPDRPSGQTPVSSALPADQLLCRHHRFFFQVVVSKELGAARAILLSSNSKGTIAKVAGNLLRGDGCPASGQIDVYCTAIPDLISASLLFEILANGKPLAVPWGSTAAGVVGSQRPVKLFRSFRGERVPVVFDSLDPGALRIPLWPGDVLTFGNQ